jgi:hypothetical protein
MHPGHAVVWDQAVACVVIVLTVDLAQAFELSDRVRQRHFPSPTPRSGEALGLEVAAERARESAACETESRKDENLVTT